MIKSKRAQIKERRVKPNKYMTIVGTLIIVLISMVIGFVIGFYTGLNAC